jgi:hypothetical protein
MAASTVEAASTAVTAAAEGAGVAGDMATAPRGSVVGQRDSRRFLLSFSFVEEKQYSSLNVFSL